MNKNSENEFEVSLAIGNLLDKPAKLMRSGENESMKTVTKTILEGKESVQLSLKCPKLCLSDERLRQTEDVSALYGVLLNDMNQHLARSISYSLDACVESSKTNRPTTTTTLDENRNEQLQEQSHDRLVQLSFKDQAQLSTSMNKLIKCPVELLVRTHKSHSDTTADRVVTNATLVGLLTNLNVKSTTTENDNQVESQKRTNEHYMIKVKLNRKRSERVCLFPSVFEWILPNVSLYNVFIYYVVLLIYIHGIYLEYSCFTE